MSIRIEAENTCVCCGEITPEGRQICMQCEMNMEEKSNYVTSGSEEVQESVVITARSKKTPFLDILNSGISNRYLSI